MKQKKLFTQSKRITTSLLPVGYYSRDKPNVEIRKFIEEHIRQNPYDPENDNYGVQAFAKPIKTTKATAIYNMHTYWSKKPHTAITQYINHYTKPGDLVLDPMCGSGGTALAALMEGRKAIAIDLSPAATFITKNYCTPVDVDELQDAFEELLEEIKPEIEWLYETRCDQCGGRAITQFTVFSQRFQCPRCLEIIPLFDCVDAKIPTKTQQKGITLKLKKAKVCPYCNEKGHLEEISTRTKHFGYIPVLVNYKCLGKCKPKHRERVYNDKNQKKREYFEKYDLSKIKEIEKKEIPYWYPPHKMMNVDSDVTPWGDKWRAGTSNFRTVAELFTKRNLWALAIIRKHALQNNFSDILLFTLTAISLAVSRMQRYSPNSGFPNMILAGTYYIPQIGRELNVFDWYFGKKKSIIRGFDNLFLKSGDIMISTQSCTQLDQICSKSVDYIFTDPPYAGKVQYGELNFIWEAWLNLDTNWHSEEIIVNNTRGMTKSDWAKLMKEAMKESYRVLKPGRWISLCYHDTSEGTWKLIQDLMAEVGFIPEQNDSALFIETGQKSFNQLTADKVSKRDLVFNFRKPKPGETSSFIMITSKEDPISFNKKTTMIIREYLQENPGSTKDKIFDELVSRMVRMGEMQAHDFDSILNLVANPSKIKKDPTNIERWSSRVNIERWYLKDTELDVVDVAESTKEKVAADILMNHVKKYLLNNPEFDGVHYSDVFEHYIFSVKDKPRRELRDWLLDYFFVTEEGTYRPPLNDEEERVKKEGRTKGLNRHIKRFIAYIQQGVPIPEQELPDNSTIVEWILHSRRAGLYFEGKVLFENAGLLLDNLNEETRVELEEAYQTCTKMVNKT